MEVRIDSDQKALHPGEELKCHALMQNPTDAIGGEFHVLWYTEGRGTQDIHLVHSEPFHHIRGRRDYSFSFELPQQPYSFSGKLISLIWAVEVVIGDSVGRATFTLSPHESEITL